ncbi:MAG: A/G-specific adenine glycosylase, partial [Halobacteriaceae archaeon]
MDVEAFRDRILSFYEEHGRDLPWRETTDPYKILVSEVMLQQTQVTRVIPKFNEWIDHWPTVAALAEATIADVMPVWQGLGYN